MLRLTPDQLPELPADALLLLAWDERDGQDFITPADALGMLGARVNVPYLFAYEQRDLRALARLTGVTVTPELLRRAAPYTPGEAA